MTTRRPLHAIYGGEVLNHNSLKEETQFLLSSGKNVHPSQKSMHLFGQHFEKGMHALPKMCALPGRHICIVFPEGGFIRIASSSPAVHNVAM